MGKIQVGQKNPKTVDMGGFTVVTNPALEETNDVLRAKEVKELFSGSPGKERELEGSYDYVADDKVDTPVVAKEVKSKKNQKA